MPLCTQFSDNHKLLCVPNESRCNISKEIPIYEIVEDFGGICDTLISLNEDRFGHIDAKMLRMTMITNKEPPEAPPFFKIVRVNNPVALFCPFRFVAVTWQQKWEEFDENRKGLLVCDILNSLEPDENEPKVISPDIKAHGSMLRTFGVDYMLNPGIRNVLTKPIDWVDTFDFDVPKSATPPKDTAHTHDASEDDTDTDDEDDDNIFGGDSAP